MQNLGHPAQTLQLRASECGGRERVGGNQTSTEQTNLIVTRKKVADSLHQRLRIDGYYLVVWWRYWRKIFGV